MTPMDLDNADAPSWKIEGRGRAFTHPRTTTMAPFTAAFEPMIYPDKRNPYPIGNSCMNDGRCAKADGRNAQGLSWDDEMQRENH